MNKQTLFTRLMVLVLCLLVSSAWGAERTTYYHLDLLGSPVAASDPSGQVRWREEYKPYGERLLKPGASSGHTLWYTGKVHDDAVGLSYYGARWHDPELGRFTGIDPVDVQEDNVQSFNRYAYANNNPYKYVDPDGRAGFLAPLLLFIGKEAGSEAVEQVTGVPLPTVKNAAKTTAKIVKKAASKGGGQTFDRVVSNAELKSTQQTGLLRGGREGENFFTDSASLDAKRSQQRLGLDGPLRDARIRFRIKNDVEVTGPRRAAPGQTGTAGGGREFSTNGRTEIEILRVDPLRK